MIASFISMIFSELGIFSEGQTPAPQVPGSVMRPSHSVSALLSLSHLPPSVPPPPNILVAGETVEINEGEEPLSLAPTGFKTQHPRGRGREKWVHPES